MSRYRRLRLSVTTAYPGILGINYIAVVVYQGQIVYYEGQVVMAPTQGEVIRP